MFYQTKSNLDADALKVERGRDFSFPAHLHGSFELIAVTEGELLVIVDGKKYTLTPGLMLLIFPHQTHELRTLTHSRHFLCIFSAKLVAAYGSIYQSRLPASGLFAASLAAWRAVLTLSEEMSVLAVKGILYTVCAEFDRQAVYVDRKNVEDKLLPRIFDFVEENYKRECTLMLLSEQLSYSYEYLSRYFKEATGLSFTGYVSRYRINEACYLLRNSTHGVLNIAYECGFDSLRSFNRNFKQVLGQTPSEYRAGLADG